MFYCHCQFFHFVMMNQRYFDAFQTFDALSICLYDDNCDFVIFFALIRVRFSFWIRFINVMSSRRYLIAVVYRDSRRTNSWKDRVWLNKCYVALFQLSFQSSSLHCCECFSQFRASFFFVSYISLNAINRLCDCVTRRFKVYSNHNYNHHLFHV